MGTPEAVSPLTWQRAAIRDERLGSSAVAVTAALVTIAPGQPGDFYGSVPRIMRLSRLGERSVRGVLSELQQLGYLFQVKRGGRHGVRAEASTWRLTLSNPASGADWDSPDVPNLASRADWEPVDNPIPGVPNLHETASQPAPRAVPREKDFQEPHHDDERERGLQPLSALPPWRQIRAEAAKAS